MDDSNSGTKRSVGLLTAISIAVANMVGTGVFTSLGYQVVDIKSIFVLIMLWIVGGVVALCGALSYGELGAALPRSGGEYHLLSEIYHPSLGFLSGWISLTAGFAAPTAIAAIALGEYTHAVFPRSEERRVGKESWSCKRICNCKINNGSSRTMHRKDNEHRREY